MPMSLSTTTTTTITKGSPTSILYNIVVLSILITETAERVAYYGFRAILVLYFTSGLQFTESTSVSLCAGTVSIAYLSPLLGASLADSSWGRYRTIWRFGLMYAVGLCLLTVGANLVHSPSNDSTDVTKNESNSNDNNTTTTTTTTTTNLTWARLLSFVGLVLICIGTGGIKPCVSAFGADQVVLNDDELQKHQHQKDERIREFFNSFYFCINVGALLSFAIIPLIRANCGFSTAFLVPTVCMIFALIVFMSQRKSYKHRILDPSTHHHNPSLFKVIQICFHILLGTKENAVGSYGPYRRTMKSHTSNRMADTTTRGEHILLPTTRQWGDGTSLVEYDDDDDDDDDCAHITTTSDRQLLYEDACQVLHLMPLILFFPVFWMLYDQQGSVWTLQATRLNLHGLEPEQLQFLNPLEIMIFIPLFDRIIYPWLDRHRVNIEPLRRMEYGMFLTAISFCCSAGLEFVVQNRPPQTVSLAWQIPQITILTVAEILLNVTGLEFAYSQAPSNMQAIILATFLFMTAIGDGMAAILFATVFAYLNSILSMMICAICMLINMGFFAVVARRWKPYSASHSHPADSDDNEEYHDEIGVEMRKIPL
jgi:dipeptide/tripeptide permease